MEKFNLEPNELYYYVKKLHEDGCAFQYFEDEQFNGRTVTVNKRELIHFASCSYLGLETHPDLVNGAIEAVKRYGTQTPSSRAMFSSPLYKELEELLTGIFPGHHIIAQTVTLAHCGVLPLLINEADAIILDAYVHNSVRMASELCRAKGTFVVVAKHNNMEHVKYLAYRLKKEGKRNIWYCADGIYSIHGNLCDVKGLQKILDEEDRLYAYVDDAHGTGWCGKHGSGHVIGNYGLHEKMIVTESFAKSMAASGGGIIVPDKLLSEVIRFTGQTMIFSGPLQPPLLGALLASVRLHLSDTITGYQQQIKDRIVHFRAKCAELKIPIVTSDISPIQLLRIGDIDKVNKVLNYLIARGFFSMTAGYPAISRGDEGIRISLTRHLSIADIDNFLLCLKEALCSIEAIVNP